MTVHRAGAIRKPVRASMETRNAFTDTEKELNKLKDKLAKLEAEAAKEAEEKKAEEEEDQKTGEFTQRSFIDASDFGSGFAPPDHILTSDGAGNTEWAPVLGGVMVVGPAGEGSRSLAQQVVGIHGSLYILGALSVDTILCRDINIKGTLDGGGP